MEHFALAPGNGGKRFPMGDLYGGGGGGVLVNGRGPPRDCYKTQGEGYGGGGAAGPHYKGLPGVILIEVTNN